MVCDMELEKSSPAEAQPAAGNGGAEELCTSLCELRGTFGPEWCLEGRRCGASREPARRRLGSADWVVRGVGWELWDRCRSLLWDASADEHDRVGGWRGGKGDAAFRATTSLPGAMGGTTAAPVGVCCLDAARAPNGSAPKGTARLSDLELVALGEGRPDGGREEGPEASGGKGGDGAVSGAALTGWPAASELIMRPLELGLLREAEPGLLLRPPRGCATEAAGLAGAQTVSASGCCKGSAPAAGKLEEPTELG